MPSRSALCAGCVASVVLVPLLAVLAAHGGSPTSATASANFALMRLFRDLSRIKARRRRFGQQHAVMLPVLLGREEPCAAA